VIEAGIDDPVYQLVDGGDWLDASDVIELPARSAACVVSASALPVERAT
jgi:hypothetical protein